jgi:hypothetical protein
MGGAKGGDAGRDSVMKARTLLVAGTMLVASPLGAGDRLAMKVTPAVCFSPANLIVRTRVEADPKNRELEVSAESVDFYRSSAIQLEGERAPRTRQFEFRSLPPGTYSVRVNLFDAGGHSLAQAQQDVRVIASGGGQ